MHIRRWPANIDSLLFRPYQRIYQQFRRPRLSCQVPDLQPNPLLPSVHLRLSSASTVPPSTHQSLPLPAMVEVSVFLQSLQHGMHTHPTSFGTHHIILSPYLAVMILLGPRTAQQDLKYSSAVAPLLASDIGVHLFASSQIMVPETLRPV